MRNKNIKLPRKRKKTFIKAHSKMEYMVAKILGEILHEENRRHADRFYSYRECITRTEYRAFPNGYYPVKRW